jgi:Dolichyl-phosphate-mannose-protein mannosyltransferase
MHLELPRLRAPRVVLSTVLAGCCALVLHSHVYVSFERIRLIVVTTPKLPAQGNSVVVLIPDPSRLSGQPVAIVVHLRNTGLDPRVVRIALRGSQLASVRVASNRDVRVDLSVPARAALSEGDPLELVGDGGNWVLTYLELANIHGFSRGFFSFVIVPASLEGPSSAPLLIPLITFIVLLVLPLSSLRRIRARVVRIAHVSAAGLVLLFFVAALIASRVSPYRVLLSLHTYVLVVAILYFPSLPQIPEHAIERVRLSTRLGLTGFWRGLCALAARAAELRIPAPVVAALLAAATTAVGVAYGTMVAGGSDSYGYVSQSELWLTGHLKVAQPWVEEVPWPNKGWSFAPLGFRPAADEWAIVPTYAPGLPLLMAAARLVGGSCAAFWVVPLAGGILVFATYGLGRRLQSPVAGVLAAWLVATSPAFLEMVVQPMTDVPIAAAWAATFYFLFGGTIRLALAAGLTAGLAVLIRPNLAPLASVVVLWLIWKAARAERSRRADRIRELIAFVAALAPGVLATAAIQTYLYGAPWRSGYGTFNSIFDRTRFFPNLANYAGWMSDRQTPMALVGLAAVLMPFMWLWPSTQDRSKLAACGLFVVGVWVSYCLYLEFDSSGYLRFLLPTWPFMMIGVVQLLQAPARSRRLGGALVPVVGALALGLWGLHTANEESAFTLWQGEIRYTAVARLVREATPENSVIFAMQHSGSVRYYGGRTTLRFDALDADWLDRAVRWFAARGIHSYLVADGWEIPNFRHRFPGQATTAVLDSPPLFVYRDPGTVYFYDLLGPRARGSPVERFEGRSDLPRCSLPQRLPPLLLKREQ